MGETATEREHETWADPRPWWREVEMDGLTFWFWPKEMSPGWSLKVTRHHGHDGQPIYRARVEARVAFGRLQWERDGLCTLEEAQAACEAWLGLLPVASPAAAPAGEGVVGA